MKAKLVKEHLNEENENWRKNVVSTEELIKGYPAYNHLWAAISHLNEKKVRKVFADFVLLILADEELSGKELLKGLVNTFNESTKVK